MLTSLRKFDVHTRQHLQLVFGKKKVLNEMILFVVVVVAVKGNPVL